MIGSAIGGGLLLAGGAAWFSIPAPSGPATLEAVLETLQRLRGKPLKTTGVWSPAKVLLHNAQSIDLSMAGFPQAKSAVFQAVVGKTAFALFSAKGAMRHGLTEPIPGAPDIPAEGDTTQAIDALIAAIGRFREFAGPLKPHFAYGELDKDGYAKAHAMHFFDHMREISVSG